MGIRCADHVTPLYPQKLALTSPTGGGRSVGIVRSRTKATEFFFIKFMSNIFHASEVSGLICTAYLEGRVYLRFRGNFEPFYVGRYKLPKVIAKLPN